MLWFYLEPSTFISEDEECYFFYNTDKHDGLSFRKNESIVPIVEKLRDIDNLYCIRIGVKELEDELLYDFVQTVQTRGYGDFLEGDLPKPIVMPPYLNLQRSIERMKRHNVPINENILSYLHEVFIHINGEYTLGFNLLKEFLSGILCTGASVTLLGDRIFHYEALGDLLEFLRETGLNHTLVANYMDISQNIQIIRSLSCSSFRLKATINSSTYQIKQIIALSQQIKQYGIDQIWEIYVTSVLEFEKAEILYEQLEEMNIDLAVKPYYDGENLEFFKENIFTSQEDIDHFVLDRQDIFSLQVLNTNDFGKITLAADGKVYANVNNAPIGSIGDSIENMLCKELEHGTSWRYTRYIAEPCCQCRFKLICPSPSDYEKTIGRNNMCHIKY